MLERVIEHINLQLSSLNIFQRSYGLCEIITKSEKSFPAEYCGNEYKQVEYNNTVYHRLTGSISISEDEDQQVSGCGLYSERSYPLRLVACVKKNIYKSANNDAYIDQKIAENIESVVSFSNNKVLSSALKADTVSARVTSITTNRNDVFRDEYKNYDMFIDYEYAYIALNYTVIIAGDLSCYQLQQC